MVKITRDNFRKHTRVLIWSEWFCPLPAAPILFVLIKNNLSKFFCNYLTFFSRRSLGRKGCVDVKLRRHTILVGLRKTQGLVLRKSVDKVTKCYFSVYDFKEQWGYQNKYLWYLSSFILTSIFQCEKRPFSYYNHA